MYYVTSYHLKEKKSIAYQNWLMSDEAKKMFADVEKETGFKYIETFWPIMGLGEFGCEDWWEAPDWSSFEKARVSEAMDRPMSRTNELDFADNNRPSETRVMRSTRDVKIWE
jgi:hypothetical protein